jgi:hypothetical protein
MSLQSRLRKLEFDLKAALSSRSLQVLVIYPFETKEAALTRCNFHESEIGIYVTCPPRPLGEKI